MKTLVMILGAGHSGSTLLDKALGSHPSCFSLGEVNNLDKELNKDFSLCGCSKPIRECDFWLDIVNRLSDKYGKDYMRTPLELKTNIDFDSGSKLEKIVFLIKTFFSSRPMKNLLNDRMEEGMKISSDIIEMVFEKTGADILIDSTKNIFRSFLYRNQFREYKIKFIHLVRDGRSVLNSYQKKTYNVHMLNETTGKIEKKIYPRTTIEKPQKDVKEWMSANIKAGIFLRLFANKDRYFLRYEDFTTEPEKYLRELAEFMEIDYDAKMLRLDNRVNHMCGGNASRINAVDIKKPSESWKKDLDNSTLSLFNKKAGWLNRNYGYK